MALNGAKAINPRALAAAQRLRPSARWERAALPGAPMVRRVGGGKSAGWPAWMPASFSPVHGRAVEKPRNPPAYLQGRMPGGRAIGVPFLFGYFLLTPGILPSALPGQLRCSHALLRMRGHAKRK